MFCLWENGGILMISTLDILALQNSPGIGRNTINNLLPFAPDIFIGVKDVYEFLLTMQKSFSRIKVPEIQEIQIAYDKAFNILEQSQKKGIKVISVVDENFPTRLHIIPDPPVVIYVKGNEKCLHEELSVAIIGTREPSEYGVKCGELFGKFFAEKGLVVVSGLASGIDASGHRGCINGNGQTVGVLAQGLDTPVYPKINRELAEKILNSSGCLMSEYAPLMRAQSNMFVERDRLQSGLSAGVVVIETDIKGGTMHTVGFCLKENKPLGCLNHPEKFLVGNDKARGNQMLISEKKATPLFNSDDIDCFITKMLKISELTPKPIIKTTVLKEPAIEQISLDF
jgi:DNA processing protein